MAKVASLFCTVLLVVGSARGALSEAKAKATCVKRYSGTLITNEFQNAKGETVFLPFYLNKAGFIAYNAKNPTGYPKIKAEFQTCTPNYSGGTNKDDGNNVMFYGRIYIPKLNKCIAGTNLEKGPPYYVTTAACPSAADMATKQSIPYNFYSYEDAGIVDMHWIGGTIRSKKIYQGPDPPARYCGGEYFINATNLQYGYNVPYAGQPNTDKSDNYRVHLYCNRKNADPSKGTGTQTFLVPVGPNSDPFP
ncbi:hypothetical protein RhiLY_09913 [Ceratobasidium sp. AG-Ba]|nr:hypothetical protein RhiLY_09913 [Ceratobasidium sp. AG-Ba]